jgi:hypothetical protein
MKPQEKSHEEPREKSQGPKETIRDLDQADRGGLKAREADLVRGGKKKKR